MAGAFTMMGALSIIRFRNSLKDTRDIGFIFFAIAIGMAMGTKMFLYAIISTPIILAIFYIVDHFNLFSGEITSTKLLKIQVDENADFQNIFTEILNKHTKFFSLSNVMPIYLPKSDGTTEKILEISFTITHNDNLEMKKLFSEIEAKNGGKDISLLPCNF